MALNHEGTKTRRDAVNGPGVSRGAFAAGDFLTLVFASCLRGLVVSNLPADVLGNVLINRRQVAQQAETAARALLERRLAQPLEGVLLPEGCGIVQRVDARAAHPKAAGTSDQRWTITGRGFSECRRFIRRLIHVSHFVRIRQLA